MPENYSGEDLREIIERERQMMIEEGDIESCSHLHRTYLNLHHMTYSLRDNDSE